MPVPGDADRAHVRPGRRQRRDGGADRLVDARLRQAGNGEALLEHADPQPGDPVVKAVEVAAGRRVEPLARVEAVPPGEHAEHQGGVADGRG